MPGTRIKTCGGGQKWLAGLLALCTWNANLSIVKTSSELKTAQLKHSEGFALFFLSIGYTAHLLRYFNCRVK